jgi:hypothetical protein
MAISPQENGAGDQVAEQSDPVLIKGHYLVDEDTPLIELSLPSAKAYEVSDARNRDKQLFALVCIPGLPVRLEHAPELISMDHIGIMTLVTWDVAFWPLINQKTIIMIYERPMGGSIIGAIKRGDFKLGEDNFQSIILDPVFRAIEHLDANNITHREIRAENLFFMDNEHREVVLGDCITCPPGFDQPIIYEPAHRAMASPSGRGAGDLSDDLYAFGVTIIVLILGERILEYETLEELFTAKIEEGTYSALCGNRRIFNSIQEPLRGFLIEDLDERWGLNEMSQWLNGKKQNSKKHVSPRRATQPYIFMEKSYFNPRVLAHAFTKNVKEGAKEIKDEELEIWLRDSLGEKDLASNINAIAVAATTHENEARSNDDHIVTKASILMDPLGPIRFKGLSFIPDGYGATLAVELLRRNTMQTAAEVLRYNLPKIWYEAYSAKARDNSSYKFQIIFRKMLGILKSVGPGFGIERCLYELNSSLPCQSSLITEQCVVDVKELLPALDNAADRTDKKLRPLDRHVTAFIAARFGTSVEKQLSALSEQKNSSFLIGMLSLLALLQSRISDRPLCALTSWVGSLLGPTVETYFNLFTRTRIEKEIPDIARQGSLLELLNLVDNPEIRQQDTQDFEDACLEYNMVEEQIQDIKSGDLSSPEAAVEQGQKFSALTSLVVLMIFVTILFLSEIS